MSWLAILKGTWAAIGAALPSLKQRRAERKAGIAPQDVPASLSDEVMDEALRRLGALKPDEPLWKRCLVGMDAVLVRPEQFALPSVREWLSRPQVRAGLKLAAETAIARDVAPQEVLQRLAAEYADATGDDALFSDQFIRIAVAVLKASVQGLVRDTGTAALVQATTAALDRKIDAGFAQMAEAAGLSKNRFVGEEFTQQGRTDLQRILRRRATQGQQTAADLRRLISDFEPGGRLAAAEVALKDDIVYWLARVEAAAGNATVASELKALESRGYKVPEATWALVDLARSDAAAALRRVRDLADPESRSAVFHILSHTRGCGAGLEYFDGLGALDPSAFTAVGWKNICVSLCAERRVSEAAALLGRLPASVLRQCTSLYYMYAVSLLLPMVPVDRHARLLSLGFLVVAEHVLDSPASLAARAPALEAALLAMECAIEAQDEVVREQCAGGIRCLRLLDGATRAQEIASITEAMQDGEAAVRLVWLARAWNIEFDPQPLEMHLVRAQRLGGLTEQQLHAKLYLLDVPERNGELIRFLDEEWASLARDNDVETLVAMKVQALASTRDTDGATAFLDAHIGEVSNATSARLRLLLRDARGEDPTDAAAELFAQSNAIEDLLNLVQVLIGRRRWKTLAPYAEELFNREPNFDNAILRLKCLQATGIGARAICTFLDGTVGKVEQRPEIKSARAWAHFEAGDHEEAKRLNDELLCERRDVNDLGLDVNIAICTGDWDRFPAIGARAREAHAQLSGHTLLTLARLVGFSDPSQALNIAQEAVAKGSDDPAILIGAYAIAIAARRDDLAMPWVHRAASLSKKGGPVSVFSSREMVEFIRTNAESWKQKNELYRTAQMPLHVAASAFNTSFSHLLVAVPRQNAKEADPRRRQPVPIRSGSRVRAPARQVSRLALDITSLFVLSEIGKLGDVLDSFEQVFVSPRLMDVLLDDRRQVAFHQPSRIAEVKPLSAMVASGLLLVVDLKADAALMAEVGEEAAVLLTEAEAQGGVFVHPGPLFKVASYMDEEADLGPLQARFADPVDVILALRDEGVVTHAQCNEGANLLQPMGMAARQVVARGVPLYLDRLSVQYLQKAGLLQPLLNSGHAVSIHKSTVDEWHALLATEPMTDELTKAIDALRLTVRNGLISGKVKFLARSRKHRDELRAMTLLPMLDLLDESEEIEAVAVDDRVLGNSATLTHSSGRSVPFLSSLDLLDVLVEKNMMSEASRRESLHLMRSRCFFCMPVDPGDVVFYLGQATVENGRLKETAELRTIRQYLARLNAMDVLCTPADLVYQDYLLRVGSMVISKLWMDQAMSVADAEARSDWVVGSLLPQLELAMRFAPTGEARIVEVAAAQLSAAMMPLGNDASRWTAYANWLGRSRVSPLLPRNSNVVDRVADQAAQVLVRRTSEIASELRSRDRPHPVE